MHWRCPVASLQRTRARRVAPVAPRVLQHSVRGCRSSDASSLQVCCTTLHYTARNAPGPARKPVRKDTLSMKGTYTGDLRSPRACLLARSTVHAEEPAMAVA